MKATDETKLKAFLVAIDKLDPPLPEDEHTKVNQIGLAIAQQNYDDAIALIYDLTQTHPHLQERYDAARLNLKSQYTAQERSKSAILTLDKTGTDLEREAILLLTRFSGRTSEIFTERPADTAKDGFREKGDRVVAMASGGAFLGGLLGQIPGAIIGGALAGIYGWFSASAEKVGKE